MAKRRLSKNQTRRIQSKQQASIKRAEGSSSLPSEDQLGPEQRGRVIAHFGTKVEVEDENGECFRCFFRANLRSIVTGDRVIWRRNDKDNSGVVVSSEERSTLLSRPDSYGKLKPIAANIDQIILTIAPRPEAFENLIDRYIVIAETNNITPVILINKNDLIDEKNREKFERIEALYSGLGYQVLRVSAKGQQGLDPLRQALKDKTSIFVGQSGVGKSSIIKQLVPDQDIQIGKLSEAKTKGKHTTTHSQLFHFTTGGECIDSPGIREFGLWHLNASDVINGFIEIREHAQHCKFRDCQHKAEPQCAVRQALEDNLISEQRFLSYERIIASLDEVEMRPSNH